MFGLDKVEEISVYVEQSVLAWVKLYEGFENATDLTQLCDGKFFLHVLETLPNFRLSSPVKQICQQQNLTGKLSNIKNIANSLIKYHQTLLLRDVSELKISFVQLCMGNKKQLYRLIYILFSALCSQPSSRQILENKIGQLNEQKSEILRIIIENSSKIGVQSGNSTDRSWKLNDQKRILDRMQNLENKIEELEIDNKSLQQIIKNQKESQEFTIQQNKKLKQQIKKLLELNNELSQTNQKATNELKLSSIEQNTAKKKLEIVKVKYEQKITKLQSQLQANSVSTHECRMLRQKINNITQINKQIKEQNENLRQVINQLESQRMEMKKLNKIQKEQFINLKQYCGDLEIKVEELSLSVSVKSSDNNLEKCYFSNKIDMIDGSDSNRYRVKQNLEWLNNTQYYNIESQQLNRKRNSTDTQPKSVSKPRGNDIDFEIRTITERSLQDSDISLSNMKENQSIIMNCSTLGQSGQTFKNNMIKENKYKSEGDYGSLKIDILEQTEQKYKEEIKFLIGILLDLQSQLQYAKNDNPIVSNKSVLLSESRMYKFKSKVKEMFNNKEDYQQSQLR